MQVANGLVVARFSPTQFIYVFNPYPHKARQKIQSRKLVLINGYIKYALESNNIFVPSDVVHLISLFYSNSKFSTEYSIIGVTPLVGRYTTEYSYCQWFEPGKIIEIAFDSKNPQNNIPAVGLFNGMNNDEPCDTCGTCVCCYFFVMYFLDCTLYHCYRDDVWMWLSTDVGERASFIYGLCVLYAV